MSDLREKQDILFKKFTYLEMRIQNWQVWSKKNLSILGPGDITKMQNYATSDTWVIVKFWSLSGPVSDLNRLLAIVKWTIEIRNTTITQFFEELHEISHFHPSKHI